MQAKGRESHAGRFPFPHSMVPKNPLGYLQKILPLSVGESSFGRRSVWLLASFFVSSVIFFLLPGQYPLLILKGTG